MIVETVAFWAYSVLKGCTLVVILVTAMFNMHGGFRSTNSLGNGRRSLTSCIYHRGTQPCRVKMAEFEARMDHCAHWWTNMLSGGGNCTVFTPGWDQLDLFQKGVIPQHHHDKVVRISRTYQYEAMHRRRSVGARA